MSRASTIEENFLPNTITLWGGVNINCIYYTIFWKAFCLTFCQIPSPYQDSYMQIRCGSAVYVSLDLHSLYISLLTLHKCFCYSFPYIEVILAVHFFYIQVFSFLYMILFSCSSIFFAHKPFSCSYVSLVRSSLFYKSFYLFIFPFMCIFVLRYPICKFF